MWPYPTWSFLLQLTSRPTLSYPTRSSVGCVTFFRVQVQVCMVYCHPGRGRSEGWCRTCWTQWIARSHGTPRTRWNAWTSGTTWNKRKYCKCFQAATSSFSDLRLSIYSDFSFIIWLPEDHLITEQVWCEILTGNKNVLTKPTSVTRKTLSQQLPVKSIPVTNIFPIARETLWIIDLFIGA